VILSQTFIHKLSELESNDQDVEDDEEKDDDSTETVNPSRLTRE